MKNIYKQIVATFLPAVLLFSCHNAQNPEARGDAFLLKNVTLIDGNGGEPLEHTDILIQGDTIAAIGQNLDTTGITVKDLSGKTIMPALITTHAHIGALKDTTTKPENYTRSNILRQLKRYEDYGVNNVLALGTDRPLLFENGFRDSLQSGKFPGARMYSAGYGFGVPEGAPPMALAMDQVFRPVSPAEVPAQMEILAKLHPAMVKIWVDDFKGRFNKMDSIMYKTIIDEAHRHNLRAAAHVYYQEDARRLITDGLNIIAHSIRDKDIDDNLLRLMKEKGVVYIPTLSLDEFAYIYARRPEWADDAFFKASLEPGAYEMITSKEYQDKLKNAPDYKKNLLALETALRNLKRIFNAGILVSMGTDSGASPVRAQGFSEHLELELMVQAGLTPLQVITTATKNAAIVLEINQQYGTLEKGKKADLIILGKNPAQNIKNTREIEAVYRDGKEVSRGPLN